MHPTKKKHFFSLHTGDSLQFSIFRAIKFHSSSSTTTSNLCVFFRSVCSNIINIFAITMPMRIRVCVCTWSVLQLGDAHRCEVRGMCVFVHIHIHTLAVKLLFRRIRSTVWCTQSRVLFYSTVLSSIGSYLTDAVSIFRCFFFLATRSNFDSYKSTKQFFSLLLLCKRRRQAKK